MNCAEQQPTTKRLQQLNATKRFLSSQHALMLIVGEMASGKTTLLADVVLQVRSSRKVIRLKGNPNLTPSQLINALLKHQSTHQITPHQRIESQLDGMLNELIIHNQSCILVIDDAHLLPLSALAAVSHLVTQQDGKRVHLHILLSGLPVLAEKISNLLTKEIQQLTVGALSRQEAFRIIKRLLDNAGLHLPHAAANAIFTKLYRRSAGMPETLENMVKKLLAHRTTAETTTRISPKTATFATKSLWQTHRIKTFSLILLAASGYLFWGWQHHRFSLPHPTQIAQAKPTTQQQQLIMPTKSIKLPSQLATASSVPTPILTQKPHYTLQLMGSTNIQVMNRYIDRHHLADLTKIMMTKYKGHNWYVLTYGRYDQAAQAKTAIATLPKTLKSRHPWVRSTQQLLPIGGPNLH